MVYVRKTHYFYQGIKYTYRMPQFSTFMQFENCYFQALNRKANCLNSVYK